MEYWCIICEDYWAAAGLEDASVCIKCNFPFAAQTPSRLPEKDYSIGGTINGN